MIKAIIFDFDGILVESVDIKTVAFYEIFKEFPDKVKAIVRFHIDNGGMSRFDKFKYIYADIIKKPLSQEKFDRLCRDFSRLVVDKVVRAPFVKGAKEFLSDNFGYYDMYVVSATPKEELDNIIAKRNLNKYFLGIYGSPVTKEESLRHILETNGYSTQGVIFLGDSINDCLAAKRVGIRFAARVLDGEKDLVPPQAEIRFKNLFEFAKYLKETDSRRGAKRCQQAKRA